MLIIKIANLNRKINFIFLKLKRRSKYQEFNKRKFLNK